MLNNKKIEAILLWQLSSDPNRINYALNNKRIIIKRFIKNKIFQK